MLLAKGFLLTKKVDKAGGGAVAGASGAQLNLLALLVQKYKY
jgi:hypothetical protein